MASSSSSSSSSAWKYDVFLSFRGIDTRKNFVGFLYKELDKKGINTFKDDKKLEKGSSISPELIQAIQGSRFAIAVVSENYASSGWCLEELATIMECEEKKSLTVIPIFFEVDPSDVRWQKGKFAEHFEKHGKRENPDKVQRWKDALTNLANKSGMDSRNWEDNVELIDEITKDILNRLNSTASSDFTGLVGMDVHMKAIYELLDLECNNEVRRIGIWGMGGAGKTTLAKYIFENISRHFQTCCFLEDVKKIYHDGGRSGLQKELLSGIQGEYPRNSYLGSDVVKERLGHRKVLLVIDDVDDVDQLAALGEEDRWFGPGSRVIVTTRDKHLLNSSNHVYEVECLKFDEALQLFCQFAFKPPRKHPLDAFQSLSKRAVHIAGGLPLALKVFGCHLCGKNERLWESALSRLEASLNRKIMEILKISYDGLENGEKSIFLYVACFYDGVVELENRLVDALSDEGFEYGIRVLAEKSLISISEKFRSIYMHDLIKQMGREIVYQQSPDDPAGRMILWNPDDIEEVLNDDERVARAVKAISLDLDKIDELNIEEKSFKKVPNLSSLSIHSSRGSLRRFPGETKLPCDPKISFPPKLRYLRWDNIPSRNLQFYAKNLVSLKLRNSKLEKLWDGSPFLENLKEIDVYNSLHLEKFPDVSNAPNLEVITATACIRLTELPQSICGLNKLMKLKLDSCVSLQHLPDNMDMESLELVCLDYCGSLKMYPRYCRGVKQISLNWIRENELPESIGHLSCLQSLEIVHGTNLVRLPDTIGDLISLKSLWLNKCHKLQSIPETIGRLSCLGSLDMGDFHSLEHLPDTIGDMISLKSLKLQHFRKLRSIPETIGHLSCLESLYMDDFESLEYLPDTIGDLISLKSLSLWDCHKLQSIPKTICKLKSLEDFRLTNGRTITRFPNFPESIRRVVFWGTRVEEIPSSIGDLYPLEFLDFSKSRRLKNLPGSIYKLERLKKLFLRDCPRLESFPSWLYDSGSCFEEHDDGEGTDSITLPRSNIEELFISRPLKFDGSFFHLPPLSNFPFLKKLFLMNLGMVEISHDLGLLTNLEELYLIGNDFGMIPTSINRLTKLFKLKIVACMCLYSLPELPPNIRELSVIGCVALTEVSGICKFNPTRMRFDFTGCFKLKEKIQWIYKRMIAKSKDGDFIELSPPGSELRSCFDHWNEGSSLTVNVPFSSAPKGFIACIVVEAIVHEFQKVQWKCQYLKGNSGTSVFNGEISLSGKVDMSRQGTLFFNSDLRLEEDKKVVFDQILFEFFLLDFLHVPSSFVKVKECGVSLQFTSSPSLVACDGSSTSGPRESLEANIGTVDDSQEEIKEPFT